MAMHDRCPEASPWRWAALGLALALAACGQPADDPRVQRLESDLEVARERIEVLERRLVAANSDVADSVALRERLEQAEGRIATLETPEGLADANSGERSEEDVRDLLVAASRALRSADTRLARLTGEGAAVDDEPEEDTASAARSDVATAAESIVEAASGLGMEIIGLAR